MADHLITGFPDSQSSQQPEPQPSQQSLIAQLSEAETLTQLPAIVDIAGRTPASPPARIQEQFVGSSYQAAYGEAFSFATVVAQWSTESGRGALPSLDRILDFGSGWGRITRVLLTKNVHPRHLFAADFDQEMTALVNVTLPGITALTVDPMPPTFLNDSTVDLVKLPRSTRAVSHTPGPAGPACALVTSTDGPPRRNSTSRTPGELRVARSFNGCPLASCLSRPPWR